jgi:hypothetical protein
MTPRDFCVNVMLEPLEIRIADFEQMNWMQKFRISTLAHPGELITRHRYGREGRVMK